MAKKIFFIHTVSGLTESFKALSRELLRGVETGHIADDGLIQAELAAGGLTPAIEERVLSHARWAAANGAAAVQVTCSSLSPCVDSVAAKAGLPVLKIDLPMAEKAVREFSRIGVLATAPTTLKPSTELVRDTARRLGRSVTVEPVLCEGAYPAFLSGDTATHDKIVRQSLVNLMKRVEVVLLAQASTTRVAEAMSDADKIVPILSSPRLAMMRLKEVVGV